MALLTAIANDASYDDVFVRPIEALAERRDCVLGISTSGRSPNVLAGLAAARRVGCKTILLTGARGARMRRSADVVIAVPSDSTPRIQEAHITIAHVLCLLVEERLYGRGRARLWSPHGTKRL
jgi:D-sedoheptulose 7-phosphate isomerase